MNFKKTNLLSHDEWLNKRNDYITATSALWLLRNFTTDELLKNALNEVDEFKVSKSDWFKKKHLSDDMKRLYQLITMNANLKRGQDLESSVAEIGFKKIQEEHAEEYNNASITANGTVIWYIEDEKLGATPDYIINKNDGTQELIECKTTGLKKDSKMFSNMLYGYKLQCHHQLLCTGLKKCWLVVAYVDSKKNITDTELIEIDAIQKVQDEILECSKKCQQWINDVENGVCELSNEDTDDSFLDDLYNNNLSKYLEEYEILQNEAKKAEENKKVITAICKANIQVEGWDIHFKKTAESYKTEESIKEQINKLEKELEELKQNPDKKIVSRASSIIGIKIKKNV